MLLKLPRATEAIHRQVHLEHPASGAPTSPQHGSTAFAQEHHLDDRRPLSELLTMLRFPFLQLFAILNFTVHLLDGVFDVPPPPMLFPLRLWLFHRADRLCGFLPKHGMPSQYFFLLGLKDFNYSFEKRVVMNSIERFYNINSINHVITQG